MNYQAKHVEATAPRKLIDYTKHRGDKDCPPFLLKNKMDCIVSPTAAKESPTMLPPSSSFSKKLPTCRQGNPSATLVLSWMNSLDNGSKPCQRPAVDLSNSGRNNYPLLSTLRQSGSNESYTTASKSDNMIGCSYIQLSLDLADDDTKDIISSSTPEQGRQSPQPLAWEDGEMVDFHLKIPSQTSIRHQRRSDLRERFQIHGPTRRVGILQNLLSTAPTSLHKSKSLSGSQLRRSAAPSTSLDESFASCSSV